MGFTPVDVLPSARGVDVMEKPDLRGNLVSTCIKVRCFNFNIPFQTHCGRPRTLQNADGGNAQCDNWA